MNHGPRYTGADLGQMDRVGRRIAVRRAGAGALQRDSPLDTWHLTTHADADSARARARWAGDANCAPDHSAARRLRADGARSIAAGSVGRGCRVGPGAAR